MVALLGLGYWGYQSWVSAHTPAEYTLAQATTSSIAETITGSGQIAASHTLTLSPKSSGTVYSVRVTPGQKVAAGTVVATIDASDAEKTVRDAKLALDSAQLTYDKAKRTTDPVTTSFNTAAEAFADMQEALDGMDDILHREDFPNYKLRDNVYVFGTVAKSPSTEVLLSEFNTAKNAYESARAAYDATPRTANATELTTVITRMQSAASALSQANKDILAAARITDKQMIADNTEPAILPTHIASLTTYGKTLNSLTVDLASAQSDLANASGDDTADAITLERARNTYRDALEKLEDYVVRAPFAGTIATVDVQKYDTAGSATKVATLITDTSYAELSLSETDAAKISVGQKAELTFDAIDDLTINGSVIQIDPVGTVTSGVVSYTVKIGLDTNDARVRPGMTVNASIITAQKDAALVVPSSAIKTQNGRSYVEVASGAALPDSTTASARHAATGSSTPRIARARTVSANEVTVTRVFVETGIESDTMTEITSGLSEHAYVVTQTTNANGKTVQKTTNSFSLFGGNRQNSSASGSRTSTSGSTGATRSTNTSGPGAGGPPPGL